MLSLSATSRLKNETEKTDAYVDPAHVDLARTKREAEQAVDALLQTADAERMEIERARTEQLAKEAADKAEAERLAKQEADKERLAKEAADRTEAKRLAEEEAAEKAAAAGHAPHIFICSCQPSWYHGNSTSHLMNQRIMVSPHLA